MMPYSLIPLTSEETIWEWDIVSDYIFLSHGAINALNLAKTPRRMADFYHNLSPAAARELAELRNGVISGKTGSVLECGYLCNGLWIQECMMVITRNSEGHATRIIARFSTAPFPVGENGFNNDISQLPGLGVWVCNVKEGNVWQDNMCSQLLGGEGPRQISISNADAVLGIHPSEAEAIKSRYESFCQGRSLGDSITNTVRVRHSNGKYFTILVRASVLERDADGRALVIAGTVAPGESQLIANGHLEDDDRLFHAMQTIGAGQWNWDTKADAMNLCPRIVAMLGYNDDEGADLCKNWRSYIHPDDYKKIRPAQMSIINDPKNGDTFEFTYRVRRGDGGWAWIFDRGFVAWRDSDGTAGQIIGSLTNITTAQVEREKLEDLVRHDVLTGLRSRAYCSLEMEHIEQNCIRPVTVISLDITGLKMVNDNLGHSRGDELLTKAAFILRSSLRRSDFIARTGGDEFLVLLPNCAEEKGQKLLGKVRDAFAKYNKGTTGMPVFAATGMACASDASESLASVIARADEEMYADKNAHRKEEHAALRAWIESLLGRKISAVDERIDD